ncbi:DNA integrity scanning protein [Fuerstiella marisgermanici]|uniref:DNA integrity scanning protein n=2 Tax=Fuerstiella marisgermanici TaxID=1891926 RepID=A0A1P8WHK6_9PLAN|nr:DNA integrity scanning protein [Fuerstiella marisgermanici]
MLDDLPRLTLIDAADIGIFALAVYAILALAVRHGSKRGLIAILLLGAVYLAAQRWQMPLSLIAFRIGFTAIIVSLVIVYQEDVRTAAERVGRWLFGDTRRAASAPNSVNDTLVRAVFRMADQKTGALIVIRGRDALERMIDGGIEIGAAVSEPLIYSLFDSASPGHDGAVILEDGRIARFAAHLPLAKSTEKYHFGTRHHAALGLAGCSDALVLVVSEERGVVSVAKGDTLTEVSDSGTLSRQLREFDDYCRQNERVVTVRRLFRERLTLKFVAVAIAVSCWLLTTHNSADVYRTFLVPVQYRNVPKNFRLAETLTQDVRVTLVGSEGAFALLPPGSLDVMIDLSGVAGGNQIFPVNEESVKRPDNLRVSAIEPRWIRVAAVPVETKPAANKPATAKPPTNKP